MNHRDYWRERARVLEEAENRQGRECYEEIEQQYREAQRVIEGKIFRYSVFSVRNEKTGI